MLRRFGPALVAEPISQAVLSLRTLWTFKTFGNDVVVLHSSTDGEMTAVIVFMIVLQNTDFSVFSDAETLLYNLQLPYLLSLR